MVTFDLPSSHEDASEKAFRVTPHPNKSSAADGSSFLRLDNKDDLLDDMDRGGLMDPCVTSVSSPTLHSVNNDAGEFREEERDEASLAWERWLESTTVMMQGEDSVSPTVEAYLMAKQARHTAKQAFEDAVDECLSGLTQAMTVEMIQDTVGLVYQEQSERLDDLEADTLITIQSNHERRQRLCQMIEHTNNYWRRQYKKLRRSILHEPSSQVDDDDNDAEVEAKPEVETFGEHPGEEQEPKWDEILNHQPSSDRIMAFLSARQQHQDTNETFHLVLDEIHAGLKDDASAITLIVEKFYNEMETEFEAMERDIEYHLMRNSQRRQDLEARLEEAKKQSQGYFASLLSRLAGGTNAGKRWSD